MRQIINHLFIKAPHLLIPLINYFYHGSKVGYVLRNDLHLHWDHVIEFSIVLGVVLYHIIKRTHTSTKASFKVAKLLIDIIFIILICSEYYVIGNDITFQLFLQLLFSVGSYIVLEMFFHYFNKKWYENN